MLLSGCSIVKEGIKKRKPGLMGLERAGSFAVVYAPVKTEQLMPFDLLILESDAFTKGEVTTLKKQHKLVLAYLNVGELETYRKYGCKIPPQWLVSKNPRWQDHYFINPGEKGWQDLLIHKIIPPLLRRGYQGFLFDSVDMASPARFPEYKDDMAHLINRIRRAFPHILIILNNGDFLLDQIAGDIQGLLVEEVFSDITDDGSVTVRPDMERLAILSRWERIKSKWNLPVFFVDYIPGDDRLPLTAIRDIYRKAKLIPYITDKNAQAIHKEYLIRKE
ncbi:MAG TPA: hypothetical protein ENH29_08435 [Bacteroidetes bacterium]|nr:hypothetical protein [Bacteroidota bacterium]